MIHPELLPLTEFLKDTGYALADTYRFQTAVTEKFIYCYHLHIVPLDNSHRLIDFMITIDVTENKEMFLSTLNKKIDEMLLEQL